MDGSRFALVVANDQYGDPGLRRLMAPAHDAAALAEVLADPAVGGFDVQVLQNESAQGIRLAVEDFFADRSPEDLLLLHFSCHGLKNASGELFLAVADTMPTRLASTAVAADFVNRQMADSRAQRIALFLDCCYGGAFPRGLVVRAAGEAQVRDAFAGQERVGGGRGRVVVTASSAMEYAFEGGQLAADASRPSVFTSAVVDGLTSGDADRDGDGWVGLTELVGYVTDRVHRVTPNQNPQMWTFGSSGELLIARSRVRRITPAELAPELLEAMESPLTATRYGVVDYLRERLTDADLSLAYAAWQALARMTDDDSRKVSDTARKALTEATPRVTPSELHLTEDSLEADLHLTGPPLALTATATSDAPWLTIDQSGPAIHVVATPPAPGIHQTELHLTGPTVDQTVPIHLETPLPAEPEPVPEPAAAPDTEPAAPSTPTRTQTTAAPTPQASAPSTAETTAAAGAATTAPTAQPPTPPRQASGTAASPESPTEATQQPTAGRRPAATEPQVAQTSGAGAEADAPGVQAAARREAKPSTDRPPAGPPDQQPADADEHAAPTGSPEAPAGAGAPQGAGDPKVAQASGAGEAPGAAAREAKVSGESAAGAQAPGGQGAAGSGGWVVPWWLVAVLVVGAGVLIQLNWPGAVDSRKRWYDESNTGWYVYRSWTDPTILASISALVAAFCARLTPIALGVVLGCALSVAEDGLLIVGGGMSYVETRIWVEATVVSAAMAIAIIAVLRPRRSPLWPVQPPAAVLVVAGGILLLISATTNQPDGMAFVDATKLALLEPVVAVVIAWFALTAEARAKLWLTAAAATYAIANMISVIPAYTEGDSAPVLLTGLLGNALVVAGVVLAAKRQTLPT